MIFRSPDPDIVVPDLSLADYLLPAIARHGDKAAVIDGPTGRTLSYAQLAAGVRRLAAGLRRRGLRKGNVFAILLPNLPEYATAFLGIAAAGGTVTTLNPLLTADEVRYQLKDTGAQWLLSVPLLAERAIEAGQGTQLREIFCLGDAPGTTPWTALLADDDPLSDPGIDPRADLLVLPYSSGTSGLPKGVMLTHANVVAQLCQADAVYEPDDEGHSIAVAPFFHIMGMVLILLFGLKRGVTIVALPRFDLEVFLDCIQKYRIKYASLVPPIVLALAKHPAVAKYDLSSLEWVGSGAAPLAAAVEQACADRLGCRVGQGWGMTEMAGAGATMRFADPPMVRRGSSGLLWPNLEARIVDVASQQDAEPGQTGELWVRGPNVMKGYLNRPDATAASIVGGGWLRTGDIAKFDDEGFVYVVDRVKDLIKCNAYQIAPAELEGVLVSHPAVAEAAVVPSPDEEHGEVPKAFVVLKGEATPEALMAWVAERVAPYKKVRRLEIVTEIPKTPAGKLLRRVLVERERKARGV
jgi:acyl-CoA synthetase (AMP-forming)/AMP-acid ligase II